MTTAEAVRSIGSFPAAWQVTLTEDSDLVSRPVDFVAGAHTLTYHGGPTIPNPKLVLLWCGAPAIDRPKFEQFAKELMEYGYLSALTYSGFQSGKYLGSFTGPLIPSGTIQDAALRQQIAGWLASQTSIPQPDGATIYAAMLPNGVTVELSPGADSCSTFCAYHEEYSPILYAVEPSTSCNGCNQGDPFIGSCMTLSHEVAETQSDPSGQGWYEDSTGMENADMVAWITMQYGPWTVQGYADPTGNNVYGAYTPPQQQPQPQPQPQPGPDPVTLKWLHWQRLVADYVETVYATGDLASAQAWQAQLAQYEPGIAAMVAGQPHAMPANPPAAPPVAAPPPVPAPPPSAGGPDPHVAAADAAVAALEDALKRNPRSTVARLTLLGGQTVQKAVDAA